MQAAHLAVDVAEQSLQRHAAVEAALAQRLDHRTDHPPQLEQRLGDGVRFELRGDFRQRLEVLLDLLAADPAEQRELEARPQAAREVRGCQALRRCRPGRLVGAQVQQQQRAFGEQRAAVHGAQVVEQRQQHERHVAAAGSDPVDV